jgi:hypothetical protein
VFYVDFRLTLPNWGEAWNGIGAIKPVLAGEAKLPMQHRVLVPWLCWLLGRGRGKTPYLRSYVIVRYLSILCALCGAQLFFLSLLYTALLAVFLMAAALYDYTDGYFEVAFFACLLWLIRVYGLELSTVWWLPLVLTAVATLNRETAMFFPVLVFLSTGDVPLTVGMFCAMAVVMIALRGMYGTPERYCRFWMVGENWQRIKLFWGGGLSHFKEYLLFLGVLCLVIFAYVGVFLGDGADGIQLGMGLMFCALLVPSIWMEIRVFSPVMLVVIPMLV